MTGRRLLRIILGLVAANVVGVAFCFAFVLLFQFPDKVGLPSRAQQWFYGFAVMAVWPSLILVPMAKGNCDRISKALSRIAFSSMLRPPQCGTTLFPFLRSTPPLITGLIR